MSLGEGQISDYQRWVDAWVRHNFPNDTRVSATLGTAEEVGELCRAVLKQAQGIRGTYEEWDAEIQKEVGDVFLKLAHVAVLCGFSLEEAIHNRWSDVSRRDWVVNPVGHGLPGE